MVKYTLCQGQRHSHEKNLTWRPWPLLFKELLTINSLKFKDSNVVFGAIFIYILEELVFKP